MAESAQESLLPIPRPAITPNARLPLLFWLGVLLIVEVALVVCLQALGWNSTGQMLPYLLAVFVCAIAGIQLVRNRFRFGTRAVLIGFAMLSAAFAFVDAQWIRPYTSRINCKILREHDISACCFDENGQRWVEIDDEVTWINPGYDYSLSQPALHAIERLPNLDEIILSGYITDRGLSIISGYHGSRRLGLALGDPGITDRGLELLKDCQWIRALHISGAAVTDAGLVTVSQFDQLEELSLQDGYPLGTTRITDEGLRSIGRMNNLGKLSIWQLPITDKGLTHLVGMRGLRSLVLSETKCTQAGVADLQRKLPQCKIVVKNK
jgi:hypothetical protein